MANSILDTLYVHDTVATSGEISALTGNERVLIEIGGKFKPAKVGDVVLQLTTGIPDLTALLTAATQARDDAQAAAAVATTAASDADTASTAASDSAVLADRFANEALNVEVTPGKYSSRHWEETTALIARAASVIPYRTITDANGPIYTMLASDLTRRLDFTNSSAIQVKIVANLHTGNAIDGSPSYNWAILSRLGSGSVTLLADTNTAISAPVVLFSQTFTYSAEPVVSSPVTRTHNGLSIGAGNNRKIVFVLASLHYTSNATRNSTLTFSNSSGLTKNQTDATGSYTGVSGLAMNVVTWQANLANSDIPTTHDLTYTPDGDCFSAILFAICASGVDTITTARSATNTNATSVTQGITTAGVQTLVVTGAYFQGSDALPLTSVRAGTAGNHFISAFNGKSPNARLLKDMSALIGYEVFDTIQASSVNFNVTSGKSTRTGQFNVAFTPITTSIPNVAINSTTGVLTIPANGICTLWAKSDGVTYHKEG